MRAKDLDRFQADFWACFDQNRGEYKRHPVLPAVIEATRRLGDAEARANRAREEADALRDSRLGRVHGAHACGSILPWRETSVRFLNKESKVCAATRPAAESP